MSAIDAARAKVQALKLQREGAEVASIERERALRQIVGSLARDDQALVARALATVPPDRRLDYLTAVLGLGGRVLAPTVVGGAPIARSSLEQQVQWAGAEEEYGDEFDQILHQHAQAAVDESGRQVSDLTKYARIRQKQEVAQEQLAPNTRVTPPGKGVYGQTVVLNSGAPPQQVINWQALDDNNPFAVTITLGPLFSNSDGTLQTTSFPAQAVSQVYTSTSATTVPVLTPPGSLTVANRLYAEVQWTTQRASSFLAQVDVGKGCEFPLNATSVIVNIGLAKVSGAASGLLAATGSLGHFSVSHTAPVTRTIVVNSVAASGSATHTIPAFARQLLPVLRNPYANEVTFRFSDMTGATIGSFVLASNTSMTNSVPIPFDADTLQVSNTAGVESVNVRCVYELAF